MRLINFSYSEYDDTPREWVLANTRFDRVALIVGRNATGKSRTLNVLQCLAQLISNTRQGKISSGRFDATFVDGRDRLHYIIHFNDEGVERESLHVGRSLKLDRQTDGFGRIYSDQLKDFLEFKIEKRAVAVSAKRDAIQHPFLEALNSWGTETRKFNFGEFGRGIAHVFQPFVEAGQTQDFSPIERDTEGVTKLYEIGFRKYNEGFDESILRDLKRVGYNCTNVGLTTAPDIQSSVGPVAWLFVQESDLQTPTRQFEMSSGMFRVLALIIHINYMIFSRKSGAILIDDIGEGLDYERSSLLIEALIRHARSTDFQLIMTTNDRFIMNKVSLDYWYILDRKQQEVKVFNKYNSKKKFEEFKYMGLNNFDLFSREIYKDGEKE